MVRTSSGGWRTAALLLPVLAVLALEATATGAVENGTQAPDFTLPDSRGKSVKLSDYRGRFVVLEWLNTGCPFVKKHYDMDYQNMQGLQRDYTGKGVAWFSIISSAPGKQGYLTPEEANAFVADKKAAPTAVLLDPEGKVGRPYGARTTPHMYIIAPDGRLIYQGAIDDRDSFRTATIKKANNYVRQALEAAMQGQPVAQPVTEPYGCSVKYRD